MLETSNDPITPVLPPASKAQIATVEETVTDVTEGESCDRVNHVTEGESCDRVNHVTDAESCDRVYHVIEGESCDSKSCDRG